MGQVSAKGCLGSIENLVPALSPDRLPGCNTEVLNQRAHDRCDRDSAGRQVQGVQVNLDCLAGIMRGDTADQLGGHMQIGTIWAAKLRPWLPVPNQELSLEVIQNTVLIGHRRNSTFEAPVAWFNLQEAELVTKIKEKPGLTALMGRQARQIPRQPNRMLERAKGDRVENPWIGSTWTNGQWVRRDTGNGYAKAREEAVDCPVFGLGSPARTARLRYAG